MSVTRPVARFSTLAIPLFAVGGLAFTWLMPATASWTLSPYLGHSLAVPLLMGYLWWERWQERPTPIERAHLGVGWWLVIPALLAVHLFLRLFLTPFPLWPLLLLLYTLLLAATCLSAAWLVAGRAGLHWVAGPLLLVISALPSPTFIDTHLIIPLREIMAAFTAEFSNFLGQPAIAGGTSVQLGNGWVGIEDACGGIRSLQACLMIGLFFGEWYRFSIRRRVLLAAAGVLAALAGNFGRVLFLSLWAAGRDRETLDSIHDVAGWVAMGASLAVTGWLACWWAGFRWPRQATTSRAKAYRMSKAWLWLSLVVGGFLLNETLARSWFALGETKRSVIAQWTVRLPADHWSFQDEELAESAREMLRPDLYLAGRWQPKPELKATAYYIEWQRGQVARSVPFLHNPTVCLPLSGCELIETLPPLILPWSGGQIPFYAYKFRRSGKDLLVAFTIWDPAKGALLAKPDEIQSKSQWLKTQWQEVREAKQHQPAQLLTVTIPWSDTAPQNMHEVLQSVVVVVGSQADFAHPPSTNL